MAGTFRAAGAEVRAVGFEAPAVLPVGRLLAPAVGLARAVVVVLVVADVTVLAFGRAAPLVMEGVAPAAAPTPVGFLPGGGGPRR